MIYLTPQERISICQLMTLPVKHFFLFGGMNDIPILYQPGDLLVPCSQDSRAVALMHFDPATNTESDIVAVVSEVLYPSLGAGWLLPNSEHKVIEVRSGQMIEVMIDMAGVK